MSNGQTTPEKLILVVHGVGDPQPGETLNLFARSLAEGSQPLNEVPEAVWLAEGHRESDYVETFPVHQRHLTVEGSRTLLCEMFWGDLSRVRRGWLGVIRGMFQIIFGLRYVAYAAADQSGVAAQWLKRLGLISSRILHGPVLAVTIFLSLLLASVMGTHLMWPTSYRSEVWTPVVVTGCSLLTFLISIVGRRLTRSRVIERFWFWTKVTAGFVAGLIVVKWLCLDIGDEVPVDGSLGSDGLLWYCRVLLILLGLLWFVEIQVLVGLGLAWLASLFHNRAYAPALHVAFLLPALAVGIWGQALPMLWVTAREGIDHLARLDGVAAVFDDAIPLLGVQLMMGTIIFLSTLLVFVRYAIWRSSATVDRFESGNRVPRLIVHNLIQIVLAGCTIVGMGLVSTLYLLQFMSPDYRDFWIVKAILEANKYMIGIVVPLGGILFFVLPRIRSGFDIVLDVVNHFYFRPTNLEDVLDDDDEFNIAETTIENGSLYFSRRDLIHRRMIRILSHYRDCLGSKPELVVVSHSQGTMVAVEVLNDADLAWLSNSFRSVTLVTMGSPLKHLYQHYFNHYYPALDQPFWSSLRQRLNLWINVFRVDDFVGTELDFPSGHEHDQSDFGNPIRYRNCCVGPRGHASYWSDREVLDSLKQDLFPTCQRSKAA